MRQRILTGLVLAAIFLPLLWVAPFYFSIVAGVILLICVIELLNMYKRAHAFDHWTTALVCLGTLAIYAATLAFYHELLGAGPFFVIIGSIPVAFALWKWLAKLPWKSLLVIFVVVAYIGLSVSAVAYLQFRGVAVLIYVLLTVMLTDSFAYFVGIGIGKHKLAPTISPKKTVEGAIGGTLLAVPLASVFAVQTAVLESHPLAWIVLVGVLISITGQLGDLFASYLKRTYNIKDFSKLLPGHGGLLDRLDSTLLASLVFSVILLAVEVL